MSKLTKIQTNFSWGEISPSLLARIDLSAYNQATKTMENAFPMFHGGAKRRGGTTYVGEIYNSNEKVKLIPFEYSRFSSYVIIINGGKLEFIKDGAFIESGGSPYQVACPYLEADLDEIRYSQFGNVLFLVHPDYPPKQLERITDTSWSLTNISFTYRAFTDYWYENFAISFKLLGGSTKFVVGDKFTIVTDGAGGITSVTPGAGNTGNGTLEQASATDDAPAESWTVECLYAEADRQEWSVSGSTSGSPAAMWMANNYPSSITFYQQRLFLAGTPKQPQKIWGSKAGDYTNISIGGNDDDGLSFTAGFGGLDQITHLVSAKNLLPITYGGEYAMGGSAATGITPTSIFINPQTNHGANDVRPIKIGNEVVFVQKDGKKLRAISYSVEKDQNIAPDITLFAEHITNAGVSDMAFAQNPDYLTWAIREDGVLLSLTLNRDYDNSTVGWARHTTDGLYESVATIPSTNGQDVYFAVNRTVNGSTKRYIEKLDNDLDVNTDCALVLTSGTPTDSWSGLDHLEGKTVDVIADGVVHPQVTVSSGSITLQDKVSVIGVGLHYETIIELLHPELGDATTSSQGRAVSIHEIVLRFKDTINCQVSGHGTANPEDIIFRTNKDGLDSTIPLFTGDKHVTARGWRSPNNLVIKQVTPMPFTLLGVVMKVSVND